MAVGICMAAKAAQYLASGRAVNHPWALILDFLSRKVLKQGTVHPRLCGQSKITGFSWLYSVAAEAGVEVLSARTLRDREVEEETTGRTCGVSWQTIPLPQRPSLYKNNPLTG